MLNAICGSAVLLSLYHTTVGDRHFGNWSQDNGLSWDITARTGQYKTDQVHAHQDLRMHDFFSHIKP